jgi:decaprenyl-phosphate phosphoribosyltransferase
MSLSGPAGVEKITRSPSRASTRPAEATDWNRGAASAVDWVRPASGLATAKAVLEACRPRQWSKNLLVLAAPGAAGVLLHPEVPGRVAAAFISFCLLASSTYLLNDVHDRHEDAGSPAKRARPIASGRLAVRTAVPAAVVLAAAGLAIAALVTPALAGVGAAYLLLTGSYTLWWREVPVADIAAVAGGFVLRAVAGGVATDVAVSRWFLIVTSFGALFLVSAKRYAELVGSERGATTALELVRQGPAVGQPGAAGVATTPVASPAGRSALTEYSAPYLRFVMILAAAVAVGAYCLWAFQRRVHGLSVWYDLTILPFVLWLLRYALLVDQGSGQAPEELVTHDTFLLAMAAAWAVAFAGGLYVGG